MATRTPVKDESPSGPPGIPTGGSWGPLGDTFKDERPSGTPMARAYVGHGHCSEHTRSEQMFGTQGPMGTPWGPMGRPLGPLGAPWGPMGAHGAPSCSEPLEPSEHVRNIRNSVRCQHRTRVQGRGSQLGPKAWTTVGAEIPRLGTSRCRFVHDLVTQLLCME